MKIVILAHEIGERFWPLTSVSLPKALLSLYSENSMLVETVLRCLPLCNNDGKSIFVVTTPEAKRAIKDTKILSFFRIPLKNILTIANTTPAPTVMFNIIQTLHTVDNDEVVVFTPVDHYYWPEEGFIFHLSNAITGAERVWSKHILGITLQSSSPASHINYMFPAWDQVTNVGTIYEPPGGDNQLSTLLVPITKYQVNPDSTTAETLVTDGWVWDLHTWVSRMENFRAALEDLPIEDLMVKLIQGNLFKAVVATKVVWSVMDNWAAIKYLTFDAGLFPPPEDPTVHHIDSEANLIRKDPEKEVILMGIDNLIIIDTKDKLLIATLGAAHEYL